MAGILKGRSLSHELTISLVLMILLVVTAISSVAYFHLSNEMRNEVEHKADEYVGRLADILSIPMWNFDARTMDQIGSVFAQNEIISEITIEDVQGHVLFRVRKGQDPFALIKRERDVRFEGELIGRVSMTLTLRDYQRALTRIITIGCVLLAGVVVVLLASTGVLLRVLLRRPLDGLQVGMERIARGDFNYDMGSVPHVELSAIAENFSRMAREVESRQQELQDMNAKLQSEIIDRRKAEDALRASEMRYSLAVQGTSDGIWDWDLKADTVYFSPRWKAIVGYADTELANNVDEWKGRIHPEDLERVMLAHEVYMARQMPEFYVEYRMLHKDGTYRWILGRGICLWDEQGKPYRMAGAHTDITAWKDVEQELREAKNTLDNVLNSMPSVIAGLDQNGGITLWNRMAEQHTGIFRSEALGRSFASVLPGFANLMVEVQRSIAEGKAIAIEKQPLVLDNATTYHDIVIYPVVTRGAFGAVVRIDDVTSRIRIEEIMVQTEKMLSVGGLAAGMAHEINNPLGGILQGAQNILRRVDPTFPANLRVAQELGCSLESVHAYMEHRGILRFLEGIRDSGQRAATIVANMLEFSRRSESRWSTEKVPTLVERTLELAANDYDLKKRYDFRHIDITRDFEENLPELPCMPTEIEQVLLNLFKNAAQAMPLRGERGDPPHIGVTARMDGDFVRIDVADNGPGMDEDVRRRIFEPFFTTKSVGEGTGLGLSVSYFIITTNHGGTFSVQSEPGVGSTFTIRLPLARRHSVH